MIGRGFFRSWIERSGMRPAAGNKEEWRQALIASTTKAGVTFGDRRLPGFPSKELQVNTVGASGPEALAEAFTFYEDCVSRFCESANWGNPEKRLLDFGCAWSRILRCFLYDFSADRLAGIDVYPEFIELSRTTFPGPTFLLCDPFPPTELPDESFDFVVGYSVFSHLSEDACLRWMREFERLLRPGGMVALTTRGRWFFDYCERLNRENVAGYAAALAHVFSDFDAARERYDRGEFIHANQNGLGGGGALNTSFYGETFIPEAYARSKLGGRLRLMEFTSAIQFGKHPIMFFAKSV